MSEIYVDTEKIEEAGNDIIDLTREINSILENIFGLMNSLTYKNNVWVGNSAEQFMTAANIDKKQYIVLKNNIYEFGKLLIDYSTNMEYAISKIRR